MAGKTIERWNPNGMVSNRREWWRPIATPQTILKRANRASPSATLPSSCAHTHRIPHAKPRSSSHSIPTFHPPGRGEGPGRRRGGLRGVPARGVVRPSTIPLGGTRRTGPPDRPTGPPPPVWGTTAPGGPRRPDPPIPFFLLPFPTHMCLALWVHNGLQVLNSSLSQPQFASLVQTAGAWHRFSIFRHSMI